MWWAVLAFLAGWVWAESVSDPVTALWVAGGAAALAYLADVQLHPWTSCWKCSGDSKVRDHERSSWRYCLVCGGSGKRRRVFARRVKKEGS